MKKALLLFLVIGFNYSLFAQYEITIEAQVLDYHSKQPIPYVNIEFTNKNLKTVTDINGYFSLTYDEAYVSKEDVLQFVTLGYTSEKVKASQFYKFLKNTNKIYLVSDELWSPKDINNSIVKQEQADTTGNIHGTVISENKPLQGAIVRLKDKFTEAVTNTEGKYQLEAKADDVLVASYLGMKTKEIVVGNNREINFQLESDGLLLDEVYLEGKAKKEEKQIDLGLGRKKSFDAIGTSVSVITEKDIKPHYYNLGDLLRGKFASLNRSREMSMNTLQGFIYDLDGMIVAPPETLPFIDIQNIETITILTSLAATNKYGTLGRGGVIIIRTKIMSGTQAEPKKPSALVTGNDYIENLPELNTNIIETVTDKVHGTISNELGIIQNVTVQVKNTFIETKTNAEGYYEIEANEGDVLVINYLGMLEKQVQVTNLKTINVVLQPDGQLLDEVFLEGEVKKEELVDLGLGQKKSFDALGYSANIVTEKDIKPHHTNLMDILGGKFAGIPSGVGKPGQTPIFRLRSQNSLNDSAAIYDVDGQIFDTNASLSPQVPIIDVQNISSITVLKSLAATNKYGTLGRGGVIVIKTKTFTGETTKPKKSALAQGNEYEESLNNFNDKQKVPYYILQLQKAKTFSEAKNVYKSQVQKENQLGVSYYLDVSDYFLKWDQEYANLILNTISKIAFNNAKALLTLAYKLEAQHKFTQARDVYQRIAILRPQDAQSYRNLAHIYKKAGYYQSALDLYMQMLSNSIKGADFSGLEQVIANELSHLLAQHRNMVDYSNVPTDFLSTRFKFDTRIVFEWNEPSVEFELQFVNPQKKFYKWSHTQLENQERMLEEVKQGYATEEYIIDDAEAGEWIINIESLTEETNSVNPTYLKYTVYKNYGLPNETQTVKVVKLSDCKPKITFDKLASN
jgi:tetratricopeptide (TPR) repeat protein